VALAYSPGRGEGRARLQAHRQDILQALAGRIWIYPAVAGYVVAVDWRDGGGAAARGRTARRRKQFLVPDDVLAG
jgi:hypothetical protein